MRYEVHQNMWGKWVIVDMETDDYVTWGNGDIATFLSETQASEFLDRNCREGLM